MGSFALGPLMSYSRAGRAPISIGAAWALGQLHHAPVLHQHGSAVRFPGSRLLPGLSVFRLRAVFGSRPLHGPLLPQDRQIGVEDGNACLSQKSMAQTIQSGEP